MSTHSTIGVMNGGNGTIMATYCHFDGYLSGVGQDLLSIAPTFEKAHKLISGGSMRTLEEYFCRDLGEDFEDNRPRVYLSIAELMDHSQEYVYLFKDNDWWVLSGAAPKTWKLVRDALKEEQNGY